MQLFVAACALRAPAPSVLAAAVREAAVAVPHMELDAVLSAASPSGRTAVAAVAHPASIAAPRRYRARTGDDLLLFDGLPVASDGSLPGYDAEALLHAWERLPEILEGQFAVARVRFRDDTVEALSDPLGLCPLYVAPIPGGTVVGNSVAAIAAVAGLAEPDPVGVATFLSLGWAAGGHTLRAHVRAVPGGARVTLTPGGRSETRHFSPAGAIAAARDTAPATKPFLDSMIALTRAGVDAVRPLRCPMTAGRDTRAVLALLRTTAAADGAVYATLGRPEDVDVRVAELVSAELGLAHRTLPPDPSVVADDTAGLVETFLALTDGLSSLVQVGDIGDLADPLPRLGVQLTGVGGEFARPGTGAVKTFGPNLPLVRDLRDFQARALRAKAASNGLLRPEVHATTGRHLDGFISDRLAEGWRTRELSEAFFIHERIGRWGSAGVRRASARDDLFSPFCSRPFLAYALALDAGERFVERAHYRILSLEPRLRDLPFATPWRPQRPGLMPVLLARIAADVLADHARRRLRPPAPRANGTAAHGLHPGVRWLLARRDEHREQCLSHPGSPLWSWVDRAALERAFAVEHPSDAAGQLLLRAVTLFWYFHGRARRAADRPTARCRGGGRTRAPAGRATGPRAPGSPRRCTRCPRGS